MTNVFAFQCCMLILDFQLYIRNHLKGYVVPFESDNPTLHSRWLKLLKVATVFPFMRIKLLLISTVHFHIGMIKIFVFRPVLQVCNCMLYTKPLLYPAYILLMAEIHIGNILQSIQFNSELIMNYIYLKYFTNNSQSKF